MRSKFLPNLGLCALVLTGLCAASSALAQAPSGVAPVQRLRIVGGLEALHQYTRHEEPFWTKTLPQLSGGKYEAEIVPFDRAGVPGADMLRLLQMGVVPFGTALLNNLVADSPEFNAPDLAGLNKDITTLKKTVASFRPYLEKTMRERHGIEPLALYIYPAQVVFCKKQITSLTNLSGRRVRVSSTTQADFISALGATPVLTGFNQILSSITSGNLDCAITGSMSGNTLGLHEVTTHIHTLPISWDLAFFGANATAWNGLTPDLKSLLRRELPKLENAIWVESERETAEGLACNKGLPSCTTGRKGSMIEVVATAQDERLSREILTNNVLPRWLQRCGIKCRDQWNQTIGVAQGVSAPLATTTASSK